MDVIAERALTVVFPDRGPVAVRLRIGRPAPHELGDYGCAVQAEGLRLWQGPRAIIGVDSWQALQLGMQFLRLMLIAEVERGATLHDSEGSHPVRVEDLFDLK